MTDAEQTPKNDQNSEILKGVTELFENPEELFKWITKNADKEVIGSLAWDLVTAIMTYLTDNMVMEKLELYGKCITEIAKLASPKELYLGVLEHFDPCSDSRHVELLIPALSVVLNRLVTDDLVACSAVLETTYSTLSYYLESLNVPSYEDFDPNAKKKAVFEAEKILRFTEKFIAIIKPVAEKLSQNREKIGDFVRFQSHSFQFLCGLLVVLAQLDLDLAPLSDVANSTQPVHIVCHDIMKMTALFYSPLSLWSANNWISLHPVNETSEEGKIEMAKQVQRGRACYFFLLFCRGILSGHFAKIFSSKLMLVRTVSSINALLSCKNQAVVWKGLEILTHVIERVVSTSISYKEIIYLIKTSPSANLSDKNQNPLSIFLNLINVAVSLPSKTIRSKAIKLLISLLDAFLWVDKFALLVQLIKSSEHAGVRGVLIGFLKDKFDQILREPQPDGSEVFSEKRKMQTLGDMIFTLPHGTETDLLDDSDRLMPALNLLRFLLLRDKSNKTGIFDNSSQIEKKFMKPLRIALDLSRTHYENELKKYAKKAHHKESADTQFTVNGMPLPSIPYEDQKKTLQAALHTFDMIGIVTVRVVELMDSR